MKDILIMQFTFEVKISNFYGPWEKIQSCMINFNYVFDFIIILCNNNISV